MLTGFLGKMKVQMKTYISNQQRKSNTFFLFEVIFKLIALGSIMYLVLQLLIIVQR